MTAGLIDLVGASFAPGETVRLTLDGSALMTVTADAQGRVSAVGIAIPCSAGPGVHTVSASGVTSGRAIRVAVTASLRRPRLAVSGDRAGVGDLVTVAGAGFACRERVTLALNGVSLLTAPSYIMTTAGTFKARVALPASLPRTLNAIGATGAQSGAAAVALLHRSPVRAMTFYFAGIPRAAGTHATLAVLNPTGRRVRVRLTTYASGTAPATRTIAIGATREASVGLPVGPKSGGESALAVLADGEIAARVVIARAGRDGDALDGVTQASKIWYFAEGYTGQTFHETVAALNPDPRRAAHVRLHLLPADGRAGRVIAVTVPAGAQRVVDIGLAAPRAALAIVMLADRPVVAERTLTFSTRGYGLTMSRGALLPATSWLFAPNVPASPAQRGTQTYLTVLNPNAAPASVTIAAPGADGRSPGGRTVRVAGASRTTIVLDGALAGGHAVLLGSNVPVVAECARYTGNPNGYDVAGADVMGLNGADVSWSFPGSALHGESALLLLYNPSGAPARVDAAFFGTDGRVIARRLTVPPATTATLDPGQLGPGVGPASGVALTSTNGQGFVAGQVVSGPDMLRAG